jgi:hypothetical protein
MKIKSLFVASFAFELVVCIAVQGVVVAELLLTLPAQRPPSRAPLLFRIGFVHTII